MDFSDFSIPIRRRRRHKPEVNLTPLIDVFSIIVIFLIKGTTLSNVDVQPPPGIEVPRSSSREAPDESLKIVVRDDKIQIPRLQEEYPLAIAQAAFAQHPLRSKFIERLKAFASAQLIADRGRSYDQIYAVSDLLYSSGVKQVIFMTEGW